MTNPAPESAALNSEAPTSELTRRLAIARTEHDEFRTRVRKEILAQHFDGPWCLQGTQNALQDLDLPPVSKCFEGRAHLDVIIKGVADAEDRDEAYNRVLRALDATCSDAGIEYELDQIDVDVREDTVDDR